MKKIFSFLLLFTVFISCNDKKTEKKKKKETPGMDSADVYKLLPVDKNIILADRH